MTQRLPHFAGSWYPDAMDECLRTFERYEAACEERESHGPLVGGVVPHAGWMYSGHIAYNVVRELARAAGEVDTVVVFGGHLGPRHPAVIMTRGDFWTPLGDINTDEQLAAGVCDCDVEINIETPEAPQRDNTIELQAPLIKHLLPDACMVTIKAPPNPDTLRLAQAVVKTAGSLGRRVVYLGSTDLSHYGPNYGWSPKGVGAGARRWVREENDRQFIEATCGMDPEAMMQQALVQQNACCPGAASAAVECGRQLGATGGELLIQALSSDIPPPGDSFVGYAGILF